MPSQPRKTNIDAPVSVSGMKIRSIEFEPIEDEQERVLRLHKERLGFYFKEIGSWLVGFAFVFAIGLYRFHVLLRVDSPPPDKERAWSALSAILGGIVGFLFGKVAE
jgi:hypothetical protein